MLPRCAEDFELDKESENPGQGHFEKLVCGVHLGETCRRIMLKLASDGILFVGQNFKSLEETDSIPTASLDHIVGDNSESLEKTAAILSAMLQVQQYKWILP